MKSAVKRPVSRIAIVSCLCLTALGAANARGTGSADANSRGPAGDYPMVLGAPFVVEGVTYTPADTLNYDSVGYAQMAEGDGVSGSHRTLPLPSYVEVTSLESGRTILVRLTVRGPMTGTDLVSLSPGAWTQLGAAAGGRVPVRVRRVNPPEAERALLRSGQQAPARMDTPPGLLAALKRKLGIAPTPALPVEAGAAPAAVKTLPAAKPSPVPKIDMTAKREQSPAPKTSPSTVMKPEPKPTVEPKAAPTAKGFYVQVGAYSTRARAEAAARAAGGSVSAAGKLWRVRVGPNKDRGQADAALAKLRAGGYADARVVTVP